MAPSPFETVNLSTLHPFLRREITDTESGSTIVSYSSDLGSGPVLWLVHGYPQSAYIWRHVAPLLKDKISLFIPELPGYGLSSLKTKASTRAKGGSLFEAYQKLFPGRDVILGGHDRGARLCHRLAVDHAYPPSSASPTYKLLGVVLLDIVPTLLQWRAFANPEASVAYFHWPFLATPSAADILEAYGGGRWAKDAFSRIQGDNESGQRHFQADQAWEVYASLFDRKETLEGSCADYAAGSDPEPQEQEDDQAAGRKLESPVLIMWSLARLGAMHGDVGQMWQDWVKDGVELCRVGCGDEVGHYLPEESHELVTKSISEFVDKVTK